MSEKTTVTVVTPDGEKQTFECETAIVFAVDKIEEFLNGEAKQMEGCTAYVGNEPPEEIFDKLIASMVGSLIAEDNKDNPVKASFKIFNVAQRLIAKADELKEQATKEQVDEFMKETMSELLNVLKEIDEGSDADADE